MILTSVISCGSGVMTSAEAEEIVKPLIEASHELNVIYFGEGLKWTTDEELAADVSDEAASKIAATNVSYAAVSADSKYQTQAEIQEATEKVFSAGYAAELYKLTFEGFASEYEENSGLESVTVYARYIENYGVLTVLREPDIIYTGREYDYSTLTVEKSGADYMVVKIETVSPDGEVVSAKIRVVKEADGWRLDSPTY